MASQFLHLLPLIIAVVAIASMAQSNHAAQEQPEAILVPVRLPHERQP